MQVTITEDYMAQVAAHAASLGLTPAELCKRAGMAESTWYRWKRGEVAPNTGSLRKLLGYRPPPERRRRSVS